MSPTACEPALPEAAWVAALAGLPKMGPVRLHALLETWEPAVAWERVRSGGLHRFAEVAVRCRGLGEDLDRAWSRAARTTDVDALWRRHAEEGVEVLVPGHPHWPVALLDDPEPPRVLFVRGAPSALSGPAVAVVGTRGCTPTGRA
nr:DNA-processing protein DprA [Actinomycetota bacterium]